MSTRRRDYLVSQGFTQQQADAILLVCMIPEQITDPATDPVPEGAPAFNNVVRVLTKTDRVVARNQGSDVELSEDVDLWATRGWNWQDQGYDANVGSSAALCQPTRAYMNLARIERWMATGDAEVYDYDVWHEITDIRANCPYSDVGNPEPWGTWGTGSNGSHAPVEVDGKWYRSNLFGDAGERLAASLWASYISTPDTGQTGIVRMLTVEEFQAIQAAANPPTP